VAATVTGLIYHGSFGVESERSGARIFAENNKNTTVIFSRVRHRCPGGD
jgi:hypothetical protein